MEREAYLVKHSRRDTNDEIRGRNLELGDEAAIRLDIAAVEIGEPKFFQKCIILDGNPFSASLNIQNQVSASALRRAEIDWSAGLQSNLRILLLASGGGIDMKVNPNNRDLNTTLGDLIATISEVAFENATDAKEA